MHRKMCMGAHFSVHGSIKPSMIDDDSILCSYKFLYFLEFDPAGRSKKHGIKFALSFCIDSKDFDRWFVDGFAKFYSTHFVSIFWIITHEKK